MAAGNQSLKQTQEQRLQQTLNPQLVALGRMLEMSTPEFEDEVRRELDDNPALEVADNGPDALAESDFTETAEQLQRADYGDDDDAPSFGNFGAESSAFDPLSIAVDDETSLMDNLMSQLRSENDLSPNDLRIAAHILGNLDSNGYMHNSLSSIADEIAIAEGIDVSDADVRRVFDMVRHLDPPGIGALDLRDCLLLQIDRAPARPAVNIARRIIAEYFDLFSKKHYDRLQSQLSISRTQLSQALDYIQTLNPKPGAGLEGVVTADRTRHIVPDFVLTYDEATDNFNLSLTSRIPDLTIDASFAASAPPSAVSPAARRAEKEAGVFIRRKRDAALKFIELVNLRNSTLMTIGRAIVSWQRRFFITGDRSDIRPMILKDLANVTGLDLSVISRATAGKYILTSHGTYPLKFFFNERPDADTDISSHQILDAITQLIGAEDKSHPLADEAIRAALSAQGFELARRTVAKYRERLGFPVARLRKKF